MRRVIAAGGVHRTFAAGGVRRVFAAGAVRRAVATGLVVFAGGLAAAQPAAAEEQPSIVKAYGLDWIERVREEAWPQPKAQRPVICLLDTGVAITPDTPADDPNGPIVARLALDGGDGFPQGELFEHRHGTDMAAVIAAPRNGVGTVGVFPQARIVSVRVTDGDETFISPAAVSHGVRACRRWVLLAGVNIGAVVMAESNYDLRPSDSEFWAAAATNAADAGGVFVAAAGNAPSAEMIAPLAVDKIATVSAGDQGGIACSFAGAPRARELRGPGCVTGAARGSWPSGSSAATAAVGALVAAIATRTVGEDPAARLAALRAATAPAKDGGVTINGGLFQSRFPGLIAPLPAANAFEAPAPLQISSESSTQTTTSRTALWRPRTVVSWSRGKLRVRRLDRRGGVLRVQLAGQSVGKASKGVGRRFTLNVHRRPGKVTVWAESRSGNVWRSLSIRAKVS